MFKRIFVSIVYFVALFMLSNTDAIAGVTDRLFATLFQKDDMPYARQMAETLIDIPVCSRFKQAIIEAGKGPPLSGAIKHKIIDAYNEVFFNFGPEDLVVFQHPVTKLAEFAPNI